MSAPNTVPILRKTNSADRNSCAAVAILPSMIFMDYQLRRLFRKGYVLRCRWLKDCPAKEFKSVMLTLYHNRGLFKGSSLAGNHVTLAAPLLVKRFMLSPFKPTCITRHRRIRGLGYINSISRPQGSCLLSVWLCSPRTLLPVLIWLRSPRALLPALVWLCSPRALLPVNNQDPKTIGQTCNERIVWNQSITIN